MMALSGLILTVTAMVTTLMVMTPISSLVMQRSGMIQTMMAMGIISRVTTLMHSHQMALSGQIKTEMAMATMRTATTQTNSHKIVLSGTMLIMTATVIMPMATVLTCAPARRLVKQSIQMVAQLLKLTAIKMVYPTSLMAALILHLENSSMLTVVLKLN